jgi:hypothetical protein
MTLDTKPSDIVEKGEKDENSKKASEMKHTHNNK